MMSYTTDKMTTTVTSVSSTSSESKFPLKSFTNSVSIKISTGSLHKQLTTLQTNSPINQEVHFSIGKESYQNTLITNNESTSPYSKSKTGKLVKSTMVSQTDSTNPFDRNVNSEDDQFTGLMLKNDINPTSNFKIVSSSLSTSPNIVASSSFRDNTGLNVENNNDLSTKTSLIETEHFTLPLKPIETSATQTKPSKSTTSTDKFRFVDSTMPSTTMKEDSTIRFQESISKSTTIPLASLTNRNSASTFKLKAPPIHTKETQNHVSVLPSYKVSITTEGKLSSKGSSKHPTKTLNLKQQIKRSSTLQKLNTAPTVIQDDQMKKSTSQSSSTIVPQSSKQPEFILKPTSFYSIHSQSYTNDLHLGNTTEPNQTMGAGALVIVVLLPFLALFLIAVATALRRKMKKSSRRERRYKNQDVESKTDRDQSQMVPLTKSEVIE